MKLTQIIAATGATLALALTGCAGDTEPTPTVTVTHTETVTPEPVEPPEPQTQQAMTDEEFAAFIRAEQPLMAEFPTFEIVELVTAACGAFDRGATIEEVLTVVSENSNNQSELNAIAFTIGAGVENYCPEHSLADATL